MNYTNPKRFYNRIEDYAGAVGLGIALVLLFLQVLMRFIFKFSIPTLEEYSIYLFIWYTFLTASDAMRENTHIRVEVLVNQFGPKVKSVFYLIAQVFNLIFCIIFTYSGILTVANRISLHTSSTTGFPMWIVWLAIPVCMALTALHSLQYVYFTIKYELLGKPLPDYIDTDSVVIDGVEIPDESEQYELCVEEKETDGEGGDDQ